MYGCCWEVNIRGFDSRAARKGVAKCDIPLERIELTKIGKTETGKKSSYASGKQIYGSKFGEVRNFA